MGDDFRHPIRLPRVKISTVKIASAAHKVQLDRESTTDCIAGIKKARRPRRMSYSKTLHERHDMRRSSIINDHLLPGAAQIDAPRSRRYGWEESTNESGMR